MKKMFGLMFVLTAALLFLAGCGERIASNTVHEKVLEVGLPGEPITLDPHQMQDYNSMRVGREIFETLVSYQGDTTEVGPGLADDWDISDNGLEYVFHLRRGVLFQDGTAFNAEAVKFSLERQINPEHPFYDTGVYPFASYALGLIKSLSVQDEQTIKITLQQPYAPFLTNLAMPAAAVVSPAAVEKHGRSFAKNPVGTGPYVFKRWKPGEELVLEKNERHWEKGTGPDRVTFKTMVNDQDRMEALEQGYLDLALDVPPDHLGALEKNKNITVQESPGLQVRYLAFNCQRPPLNDVRVRQAFNYAINDKTFMTKGLQNAGQPGAGPLPPAVWGQHDAAAESVYDPVRAVQLLREAGFPKGLTVTCLVPENGPLPQAVELARALEADLAKAGIVLKIEALPWDSFLARVFVPPHLSTVEAHLMVWSGDSGDPDNYLYSLFAGNQLPRAGFNSAYYQNGQVDLLLEQARATVLPAQRTKRYQEIQKLIAEESPVVVLGYDRQIVGVHKNVRGFNPHPAGLLRLDEVSLD